VLEPVARLVVQRHALRLDRDPALALEVHRVEHLVFHLALGQAAAELNDPIGERGLAVIDVSDDRKIPDPFHGIGGGGGRAEPRLITHALPPPSRRTVLVAPLLPRPPAHIEGVSRDTPEDHPWGSAPHIP